MTKLQNANILTLKLQNGNKRGGLMKEYNSSIYYWHQCPKCGNPKMTRLRQDTVIKNFPAYCKYCKKETVITVNEVRKEVER